jgi:chromosome segregation ATPase/CheY-like chemotaxis protein
VPALVEQSSTVRSVACVPVYGNGNPLGSVILIAFAPRTFVERDIHALERALRQLGSMIEAARRRGGVAEEPAPTLRPIAGPPATEIEALIAERDRLRVEVLARQAERASVAAELAARTGEREHLRVALEAANDERVRLAAELERTHREAERTGSLGAALAAAERERARLAEALEAAAAERAEQTHATIAVEVARAAAEQAAASALADLETTRRVLGSSAAAAAARTAELETELGSLRTRLTEIEAAAARERERAQERERESQRLAGELHAAAALEQQLRVELRQASERVAADGQDELRQALDSIRASEEARAGALAELEAARQALASSQEIVAALEDEAGHAHLEIERLGGSERATRSVQERLDQELETTRAEARGATGRLAELERELDGLRQERSRLGMTAREQEAEVAARSARVETLAAERDRLQEALTATTAERDRLRDDVGAAASRQTRAEEALAREAAERARLGAALGDVQAALGTLEAAQIRAESEASTRVVELERLRSEREQLRTERDRLLAAAAVPVVVEDAPTPVEPVRVVTMAVGGGPRARTRDTSATTNVIAVLDVDGVWEHETVEGHRVLVVAPGADIAQRLGDPAPARIVANLAAPGTLEALVALRASGSRARVWGCLAAPQGNRVLALGMVEAAVRPLDPDAVLAALAGFATRGTRVVTAGADVDALMSLRQALARQGMSVSMAWDAKQAADLFGVVRPEVMVIDLALPRKDGYAIVAAMAQMDTPPHAILLPGEGDAAAAFAAAMADPARAASIQPRARALGLMTERSEAAPVERRQKVRAINRGK